jgi:hypothetical protein
LKYGKHFLGLTTTVFLVLGSSNSSFRSIEMPINSVSNIGCPMAVISVPIEVGVLIALTSAFLAFFLFVVSVFSYRRERRSRLLYVMVAFMFFVIKDTVSAVHEVNEFFSGTGVPALMTLEHVAIFIDFLILVTLSIGLIKKDAKH